ncbi:MAG: hypothetical protein RL567_1433, partial [Bacteroidota bacterium]
VLDFGNAAGVVDPGSVYPEHNQHDSNKLHRTTSSHGLSDS